MTKSMSKRRVVAARLDRDELAFLRTQPGGSDSEKIRSLIRRAAVGDALVQEVAAAVKQEAAAMRETLETALAAGDEERARIEKAAKSSVKFLGETLGQKVDRIFEYLKLEKPGGAS